jgi:hypothetical protein
MRFCHGHDATSSVAALANYAQSLVGIEEDWRKKQLAACNVRINGASLIKRRMMRAWRDLYHPL